MRIYTRKGDQGQTSLANGEKIEKDALKALVLGSLDTLNSLIGLSKSHLQQTGREGELHSILHQLQQLVLTTGSIISGAQVELPDNVVKNLEQLIDHYQEQLPELHNFVIPGGKQAAASCHVARTACREAERLVVSLNRETPLDPVILQFINRLSDTLFVLARQINFIQGVSDDIWDLQQQ